MNAAIAPSVPKQVSAVEQLKDIVGSKRVDALRKGAESCAKDLKRASCPKLGAESLSKMFPDVVPDVVQAAFAQMFNEARAPKEVTQVNEFLSPEDAAAAMLMEDELASPSGTLPPVPAGSLAETTPLSLSVTPGGGMKPVETGGTAAKPVEENTAAGAAGRLLKDYMRRPNKK